MLIDIQPLKNYPDFRWLYFGQFISLIGSMISYVAVPYQIYQLTHNNAIVGTLGIVQLVPMVVFGLLGGTYADRLNRKKLLIVSEIFMAMISILLAWNSTLDHPNIPLIFILMGLMQAFNGFHRPAMEAITQQMVQKKDYTAAGALASFRYSASAIAGPALGGIVIANQGLSCAYLLDALSFVMAIFCLMKMTNLPNAASSKKSPYEDMKDGLRFALSKPELMGTYIIDIVAMVFAYPIALYPAMSEKWGGAEVTGWLFASMSVGALLAALFSGWSSIVRARGRMVVISAAMWGIFIIGTGYTNAFLWTFLFLVFAGAADMFSALFRKVIWNETVPNHMRGRLSGIEMISYMSGPLLGNVRAGWMAAKTSVPASLYSGGYLCVLGVILTALCLSRFWNYRSA